MALVKYVKDPTDNKKYSVDYDDWLEAAETISDWEFSISPVSAGTPLVVTNDATLAGDRSLEFFVGGGVANVTYGILLTITTSEGQIRQDRLVYVVRDV
jgi:hypothetical protein